MQTAYVGAGATIQAIARNGNSEGAGRRGGFAEAGAVVAFRTEYTYLRDFEQ